MAGVFHWPPSELENLSLDSLQFWHAVAADFLTRWHPASS
ncbi:GpE family phage tail protein [Elstera litoralis]|nr:GpE family phage tail protein [Elstera litoralis]